MSRGNHEDALMNDGPSGGFAEELRLKFDADAAGGVARAVQAVYDSLPMAVFLGGAGGRGGGGAPARHALCCHGGLEVGFDSSALLSAPLGAGAGAGAGVGFALVHGFARGAWRALLAKANPRLAAALPRDVSALLRDAGGAADAPPPASFERCILSAGAVSADVADVCERSAAAGAAGWLEGVRAARAAAARAWGARDWPAQPLGTDPAAGFMWADFIVDEPRRAALHQPGRGLAWGLPATDFVLRANGLVGVFRAHQHNNAPATGPMLDRVTAAGGAYDNWNRSGHVVTFLSGAHIPG
jgi:hypothetical protein